MRFVHQEDFRYLENAYGLYMREVLDIMAMNKTGEHGSRIEDVCSTIMKEKISELSETGLKVLKQCLGKQESEMCWKLSNLKYCFTHVDIQYLNIKPMTSRFGLLS